MADHLMKLEGADGQLYLYNDRVTISRSGIWAMLTHGSKADKDILFQNIVSVDLKPAGFSQGMITVNCIGSGDPKDFTIKFTRKKNELFQEFKEKVFQIINSSK